MRIADNQMDLATLLLMEEQKNGKSKKKANINDDLMPGGMNTIKSILPKPDWNTIPTKDTAMSEEEFEEAIKALAFKTAEKGMAMEDIGKAKEAFRTEENKLLHKYISVASPDRKAAYENFKGTPYDNSNYATVYGNPKQELMIYANGAWGTMPTKDELSKYSKFYEIYQNAMKEYETENGKISDAGKSKSANPYNKDLSEYKSYNLLNQLV
jgi:hypothetical protein